MEAITSLLDNSGTVYVRIPSDFAKYFRLTEIIENGECKIKDIGDNKAELTFKKW